MTKADRYLGVAVQSYESALASANATSTQQLDVVDWNFAANRDGEVRHTIGTIGPTVYNAGVVAGDFNATLVAKPTNVDYLLHLIMGVASEYSASTSTNTWGPKTTTDYATLYMHGVDTLDRQMVGAALTSLVFDMPAAKPVSVTATWHVNDPRLVDDAAASTSFATTAPFILNDATITYTNVTSPKIMSISMTIAREYITDRVGIGNPVKGVLPAGNFTVNGTMDLAQPYDEFIGYVLGDYSDTTAQNTQTSGALSITLENDANEAGGSPYSLVFTIPEVYITPTSEDSAGRGALNQSISWQAIYNSSSAYIIQAELLNGVDATGY